MNYKASQDLNEPSGFFLDLFSDNRTNNENASKLIKSNVVPKFIDKPNLYQIVKERCFSFSLYIKEGNYENAKKIILNLGLFFKEDKVSLQKVDVTRFIEIFEETEIIQFSQYSLITTNEMIPSVIFFIYEVAHCNELFACYLSETFLINFVSTFDILFKFEISQNIVIFIFRILLKLIQRVNSKKVDICPILPNIFHFINLLVSNYEVFNGRISSKDIISILSTIIREINPEYNYYKLFLDLLNKKMNFLTTDTFSTAVSTLYFMVKVNSKDSEFIVYVLKSRVLIDLFEIYVSDADFLSQLFPLYVKLVTQLLKFFNGTSNRIDPLLFELRDEILGQFSSTRSSSGGEIDAYKLLISKLESVNCSEQESYRSVLKFIKILVRQGCLGQVFVKKAEVLDKILVHYPDSDLESKLEIIKILALMIDMKPFRRRIFQLDFSCYFADFFDNRFKKAIVVITDMIWKIISIRLKKQKEIPFLIFLFTSEEFMCSISQASHEISDENLSLRMREIFSKLNELSQENHE